MGFMKTLIFSFLNFVFICILFSSCKDNGAGYIPINTNFYPAKLNMEWEYYSIMIIEYYDSLGNISEVDTTFSENTIVKVLSVNDSLISYNNLIKFETYDISNPGIKSYNWYSNSDSGFISIAYSNVGANQWLLPKKNTNKYLTFEAYKTIISSAAINLFVDPDKIFSDSIQYYEIPRKALDYPLTINKRWIELVIPWYRERYVEGTTNINFNGQQLNCYIVKFDWPGYNNIELNDYINLNTGLVMREILTDSIMFTTITNPDSGGFGRVSTYSNLVRFNQ